MRSDEQCTEKVINAFVRAKETTESITAKKFLPQASRKLLELSRIFAADAGDGGDGGGSEQEMMMMMICAAAF
uniref:NR LBD domain-containing protein n=1 Tax=Syphacia muris TaxID=451379 RepID=A0A0N5A8L4_9BILA